MTSVDQHKAQFRQRTACISCGSTALQSIWSSRFDEASVNAHMKNHFYNADLTVALADSTFNLVKCSDCDMMFHATILTPEWLSILYSQWIDHQQIQRFEASLGKQCKTQQQLFEQGRQLLKHGIRLFHLLKKTFPTTDRFTVLDYGCGDGAFVAALSLLGFDVYGIDFSSTRAERSAQQGRKIFNSLEHFLQSGVTHLHAVCLFETLEHLDEPRALLQELSALLLTGGILVVEVPDCSGIQGAPTHGDDFHAVHPLEHVNNFTPQTLTRFCERLGFKKISRPPAHLTSRVIDLVRTELSRFIQPKHTNQYLRKIV